MISNTDVDEVALDDFLLRMLATRSLSTEEGDAAALLQQEMRALGMQVRVDEYGNVIGVLAFGEGPTVLLDCHLDTVPVVDPSAWTRNPAGEVLDGRVYGRGTVDMKGPMAAVLYGVATLRGRDRGTVVVCGSVAEELVEGPAVVQVAQVVKPDYAIICEPSRRRIARGQRGRAEVIVTIKGVSSHSAYPSSGLNAAEVMVDVVQQLRSLEPPVQEPLGAGILVLIDVQSQPYPSLSTVPESCLATFDRRTLVGETEDDVLAPIRAVVDKVVARWGARGQVSIAMDDYVTYTGVPVQAPNFALAWLADPDSPVVSAAVRGLTEAGLEAVVGHYKFCTNGSGTAGTLGIPTIGYGPGDEDQAHKVDESIDLDDLHLGARGYAAIVGALLDQDGGR